MDETLRQQKASYREGMGICREKNPDRRKKKKKKKKFIICKLQRHYTVPEWGEEVNEMGGLTRERPTRGETGGLTKACNGIRQGETAA